MSRPYKPGTLLVLKNDNGGRLFTVFEDCGEEGVIELASMSSQQKYRSPHRRHFLINPGSAERAHDLVAKLTRRTEIRDRAIRQEKADAESDFESLYRAFETEEVADA